MADDSLRDLTSGELSELDKEARSFVYHLDLLMKLAAMHEPTNEALLKPLRQFSEVIGRLLRIDGNWHLKIIHEHIFINQNRIRLDMDNYRHYVNFIEEMKQRDVGLLSFQRAPDENEAVKFVYLFLNYREENGIDKLKARLSENDLDFVQVEAPAEENLRLKEVMKGHTREVARETFFGAIYITGGLLRAVDQHKVVNIRKARRVVQSFLELLDLDQDYVIGLTTIKNYDDYTFNHSVNVTILALNMGRQLDLNRSQLTELGLSAMFHDLGKVALPREIISKSSRLDEKEEETMHRHPVEGVKKLLRLKGVSELTVKLILSVYEHHLNYDFTGYPEPRLSGEASLYSRILRIVDSFDAMTSKRVYKDVPKHPVAALEEIWNLSAKNYDPDLVKVFINMMGIYPVGTIVQVSSGEIGVVVDIRRDSPNGPQPLVKVLTDWEGRKKKDQIIDLSGESGSSIVGYYDFGTSHIDPAWYLLNLEERTVS